MSVSARALVLEHFRWVEGHADVWAIFRDAKALAAVVSGLVEPFRARDVTANCGVESRGFLLGGAAAVELGVGFVPVRKRQGLLPGDLLARRTEPDYRQIRHDLRLQRFAVGSGDRVLFVDDWIETGRQAEAARHMVEECGATWVGCSVVIDERDDGRPPRVGEVQSLLGPDDLPAGG